MGVALTTTANPSANANRMVTLLSKKLLAVQEDTLQLAQFGIQEDLPQHASARTMRFFKPERAASTLKASHVDNTVAAINLLGEGVAPTSYRENAFTAIDVTLKQYGQVTKISDIHDAIDAFKPLMQNIELMGRDAALHTDTLIRGALVGGTHPGTGTPLTHDSTTQGGTDARWYGAEVFAAAANTFVVTSASSSSSTTLFNNLKALTQAASKLSRLGVLMAVTRLKLKNAPKLKNGRYGFLICPQHSHDLFQDSSYANAFQGKGAEGIYKGELGSVDNVTFIEHTNPHTEDETYGTFSTTDTIGTAGLIYTSFALGAGAYGVPKLAGTKSPLRPRIIVVDKADSGNPLQQFVMAGWKAYYMAVGLDPENIVAVRAKSSFA